MGRLFGTDGARGVAITELTCETAMQIGRAAAIVLAKKTKHKDESKILKFKWDFSIDAFKRFPSIMNDKEVFIKLKNTLSDTDKVPRRAPCPRRTYPRQRVYNEGRIFLPYLPGRSPQLL